MSNDTSLVVSRIQRLRISRPDETTLQHHSPAQTDRAHHTLICDAGTKTAEKAYGRITPVDSNTSHVTFSPAQCAHLTMYTHIMAQECVCAHHPILMVIHVVHLIVCSLSVPRLVPFRVSLLSLALLVSTSTWTLTNLLHVVDAKTLDHWRSAI